MSKNYSITEVGRDHSRLCAQTLCSMLGQLQQIAQGHVWLGFYPFSIFYFFSEEVFLNEKFSDRWLCNEHIAPITQPTPNPLKKQTFRGTTTSLWYPERPSSDANVIVSTERTSWNRTTCTCIMSSQFNLALPLPWVLPVLVHPRPKADRHCDLEHQNTAHLLLSCNVP